MNWIIWIIIYFVLNILLLCPWLEESYKPWLRCFRRSYCLQVLRKQLSPLMTSCLSLIPAVLKRECTIQKQVRVLISYYSISKFKILCSRSHISIRSVNPPSQLPHLNHPILTPILTPQPNPSSQPISSIGRATFYPATFYPAMFYPATFYPTFFTV